MNACTQNLYKAVYKGKRNFALYIWLLYKAIDLYSHLLPLAFFDLFSNVTIFTIFI